jgi:hypothetical protein
MRPKLKYFVLPFLLLILVINFIAAQGTSTTIRGGKPFDRENGEENFIEDAILKFDTLQIPKAAFTKLQEDFDTWKRLEGNENARMAGFCFIPIMEETPNTNITDGEYHFITVGYKIVVLYWNEERLQNTDRRIPVEAIGILGFENFMDALDPRYPSSEYEFSVMISTSRNIPSPPLFSTDSLLQRSREFDLVFLDSLSYQYLVANTSYYPSDRIPSEDERGLVIMRSVNSIMLEEPVDSFYGIFLRSLIFRPLPLPELENYPSTASMTFKYGEDCPPYWYIGEKTSIQARIAEILYAYIASTLVEVEYVDIVPWWWWVIVGMLAIVILILLFSRGEDPERNPEDTRNVFEKVTNQLTTFFKRKK